MELFFQIRDDLMNLQSAEVNKLSPLECLELDLTFSQYTSNKGFAEDLLEGKFSFPVVNCIRADTSNRQILSTLLPILSFQFYLSQPLHRRVAETTHDSYVENTRNIIPERPYEII